MKQTTKPDLTQKIQLHPKLGASLQLLSMPNNELERNLADYALSNPFIEIIPPARKNQPSPMIAHIECQSTSSLDLHLIDQLKYTSYDATEKKAMRMIIACLDEHGFFTMHIHTVAKKALLSVALMKKALAAIKTLDPPGIGAKDYKESILIQLNAKGLRNDSAELIVRHHLAELSEENYAGIEAATGISVAQSKKLLREIKKLNPYPAKSFSPPNTTVYIEPDIIINRSEDTVRARLNQSAVYRLRIDVHKDVWRHSPMSSSDRQYIDTMNKEAHWLKSALTKRYETLLQCAEMIAMAQRKYFLHGTSHMVPLRKKDIADMLGMHPSTVTRALSGKYIKSDHGLFPVDYIFSGRSSFCGKYSPTQIKHYIGKIIGDENKLYPESDMKIAAYLNALGIDISRRTVAKYRSDIGISPASIRRKS